MKDFWKIVMLILNFIICGLWCIDIDFESKVTLWFMLLSTMINLKG